MCAIRARLRTSWGNGVRIVRVDSEYEADEQDGDGEDGLAGLADVDDERAFVVKTNAARSGEGSGGGEVTVDEADMLGLEDGACPSLCLAGPGRKEGHIEGCGHQLGWEVWNDEL